MKRSPLSRQTPLHRGAGQKRKTRLRQGGRITPKKRKPSVFARVYGSTARVKWVQSQPCAACQQVGTERWPIQNHHIRNGGLSRKADYTTIIPLCPGCHSLWHEQGQAFLETLWDFIAEDAAAETQARWFAVSGGAECD